MPGAVPVAGDVEGAGAGTGAGARLNSPALTSEAAGPGRLPIAASLASTASVISLFWRLDTAFCKVFTPAATVAEPNPAAPSFNAAATISSVRGIFVPNTELIASIANAFSAAP